MSDQVYMQMALDCAKKGAGHVNPNPLVGAVLVRDDKIIATGWHQQFGGPHAERNALADCAARGDSPAGATLYVTLEPCCHFGKTPPCTDAIIESGITRVVVGSIDPNPLVAGKGLGSLRENGISVTENVLKAECDKLNRPFFHFIQHKTPYVVMKYAMTLDGKICAYTGNARWITGEEARHHVHEDRNRYAAIMVGAGTVLSDDPLLTCRLPGGRNPLRIICDSRLRTPLHAQIVQTADKVPTLIATCQTDHQLYAPYRQAGCEILQIPPQADGRVDLRALMRILGERGIDSLLLEGGSALNFAALSSGIVHLVQAYIAPKILGGEEAKSPVGGKGFPSPAEGIRLCAPEIFPFGQDILLESEVLSCSPV